MKCGPAEISKPSLLVCTDIFGITPALQAWLAPLTAQPLLLSPYDQMVEFSDDGTAYQFFTQQGGLTAYQQKLKQYLAQQQGPLVVLGFSAGAAVLWSAMAIGVQGQHGSQLQQAWLFYGGQIRLQPQLQPCCPTKLIWSQESHFDVAALHQQLSTTDLVDSELTCYAHGFLNPASQGYHPEAATHYQRWLTRELQEV
jgi:dienelactone hydrolase